MTKQRKEPAGCEAARPATRCDSLHRRAARPPPLSVVVQRVRNRCSRLLSYRHRFRRCVDVCCLLAVHIRIWRMNWKSKSVSDVAKERIWAEHVRTEAAHMHIQESFRKNPFRAAKDKPLAPATSRRPARFLDREAAFLETIDAHVRSGQEKLSKVEARQAALATSAAGATLVPKPPQSARGAAPATNGAESLPSLTPRRGEPTRPPSTPGSAKVAAVTPRATTPRRGEATEAESPGAQWPPGAGGASCGKAPGEFDFAETLKRTLQSPERKYRFPMTESQELGWYSARRVVVPDSHFVFSHKSTDMTRFAQSLLRSQKN